MEINFDWWRARLRDAIARRDGLFDAKTTGGRWINGESDLFPALVLDRYAGTLVLKLYSGLWFGRVEEVVRLIQEELSPERLVLRLSRNIQGEAAKFKLSDGQMLIGAADPAIVEFLETGLRFEADVLHGQKTGSFLDQRENRRRVESLARGEHVLNAFSFSGGFSLYAARGGARSVTDVDISAHALESSRRNFALNREAVSGVEHRFVQADVFEWLNTSHSRQQSYGLVILDPPSLARRQADRATAIKAYANLAGAGATLTRRGGLLLCCSCSAHVRPEEFEESVTNALRRIGRPFQVLQSTREPVDHHAAFPEAEYLKAIYLRLDR